MTKQRQTALAAVDAVNRLDGQAILRMRSPLCNREIYPSSIQARPQDDAAVLRTINLFRNLFKEVHLNVDDIVEDIPAHKICLWITSRGTTVSGPFQNESVWLMEFNNAGTEIIRWKEFVDSFVTKKFFPEVMATEHEDLDEDATRSDSKVSAGSSQHSNISTRGSSTSLSTSSRGLMRSPSQTPCTIKGNGRTLGEFR
ncbi:uncharacterized protein K452DRAFT_224744 [Aplosporella prunicola CBS 121167]|uniref:SnoaL-like domain-containing protein n=1 Tax=Aplosporella prunicola CBS 121167 TaxID=1176127 RepID=A0A6A6BIH1_9PEZI|nr:uncharacterized protein K452DRAFT_224744 [Aplosporella prunicola CBS 121167]KAF2143942.1 hypothetical protein K452DRAFT_224744 [Aplosporella prunicola CBS 121167]